MRSLKKPKQATSTRRHLTGSLPRLRRWPGPQDDLSQDFKPTGASGPGRDAICVIACAGVGFLFSILPHLIWWYKAGTPVWISDQDELGLYLPTASQAYHDHPTYLSDPVSRTTGKTIYPWLQMVPGLLAAKILRVGPWKISLIWRSIAGLSIGVGWYVCIRQFLNNRVIAAALAVFLLADSGLVYGQPVLKQVGNLVHALGQGEDALLQGKPDLMPQWRLITPGLSLGYLLLYVTLLIRARQHPTRPRMVLAGFGLGLLFYGYFYYWTAAFLGLVLGVFLDSARRWVYVIVGVVGCEVGLPGLLIDYLFKTSTSGDWLHRSDKFVAIGRFNELLIPKLALLSLIILSIYIWRRRHDLLPILCLAMAAMVLLNQQLVTGLQIENFHWNYVLGPSICLLVVLVGVRWIATIWRPKWLIGGLIFLGLLHLGTGFGLRFLESTRSEDTLAIMANYQKFQRQRLETRSQPMMANTVIAGDPAFVDFNVVQENLRPLDGYAVVLSPAVDDQQWDNRIALNSYLRGLDLKKFERDQRILLAKTPWGPWGGSRDLAKKNQRIASRVTAYQRITLDPKSALKRFQVRYVALPVGQIRPACLDSGLLKVQGPMWQVWQLPDWE